MKKLFLAASSLFATIPGVTVIASGIGTPPGYKVLFGGAMEAFGVLALLVLWINKNKLKNAAAKKITRWAIILGVLTFVSLSVYLVAYNYCVVTVGTRATVYYPLWLSGEAARKIAEKGGRIAAINYYGSGGVQAIIDKSPPINLHITTVLLLFFYDAIFTSLSLAFGLLGFHGKADLETGQKRRPAKKRKAAKAKESADDKIVP